MCYNISEKSTSLEYEILFWEMKSVFKYNEVSICIGEGKTFFYIYYCKQIPTSHWKCLRFHPYTSSSEQFMPQWTHKENAWDSES